MSSQTKQTIEFRPQAALNVLRTLQTSGARQEPFTLTVLGHQVVQNAEAKGLLLQTLGIGSDGFLLARGNSPKADCGLGLSGVRLCGVRSI